MAKPRVPGMRGRRSDAEIQRSPDCDRVHGRSAAERPLPCGPPCWRRSCRGGPRRPKAPRRSSFCSIPSRRPRLHRRARSHERLICPRPFSPRRAAHETRPIPRPPHRVRYSLSRRRSLRRRPRHRPPPRRVPSRTSFPPGRRLHCATSGLAPTSRSRAIRRHAAATAWADEGADVDPLTANARAAFAV